MTMHRRVQSSHTPKAYPASKRQYLFIDRSARSFNERHYAIYYY